MSDTNPYISNGTCYTARGKNLDGSFIPCGNDAFGHQTYCGAGDNCLADNACFGIHGSGYGSYLTYWAGCSDPDYEAATCPAKEIDQPWVALTLCDDSDGEWAVCSQDGNPSTLQPGSFCSCTNAASATVAFSDSNTLTSICSLPKSTGQSIQFFVGHFPSSSPASESASSSSQTSASISTGPSGSSSRTSSSATATSGPTSTGASGTSVTVFTSSGRAFTSTVPLTTSSNVATGGANGGSIHSGLKSGAKVGIGVGAGLGAVILLALISFLVLRRRKRRRPPRSKVESGEYFVDGGSKLSKPRPSDEPPMSAKSTAPPVYDKDGQIISEADGRAANPWTLRNELEGSQVTRKGELVPIAELPGSENFAGEQGARHTLAQEANRQIGPGWKGPSLRLLNTEAGKEYLQSST